jgi:tetratricopeptide (TPR) repeat protein
MDHRQAAVHRTILVVDVEGFGDQRRTNPHRLAVRAGMYGAVEHAFGEAGIPWAECYQESCGDGVFVLIPAEVPKGIFVGSMPRELARALLEHNAAHPAEERIRLRVALHAGEVYYDEHGVTAASINLAFRLLDAGPLKAALADSPGTLALIVSSWFFDEVVRHSPAGDAATYRPVQVAVKETTAVGWICLPDHPYARDDKSLEAVPAFLTTPVPRQLPARTPHFVGRDDELRELTRMLDAAAPGGDTVAILAIDGIAGVGKTALALRWANQVAQRFPDGQLYVNLRGFDPSGAPITTAEAVRSFLDTFGVPADRIPVSAEGQAQLYRSLLAGRRLLVMLDNARDAGQIGPLLPGSAGCMVLVTSRRRLADLEEAVPLTLNTLPPGQAKELFARLDPASSREPEAVGELVRRCGCLPLAIRLLAGRLRHHPSWMVTDLVAALEETRDELEEIHAGNLTVAAAFELSYRDLPAGQQRLFRGLGTHPGPDIDARAAAALDGADLAQARRLLDSLYDDHLIEETSPGRYAMHDLIRAYARALAAADDAAERDAGTGRLLDFYLHTARAADRYLTPQADASAPDGDPPGTIPGLSSRDQALAWMQAERPNLQACVEHAAATARYAHAIGIAAAMSTFLYEQGYWDQARSIYQTAAAAGEAAGDRAGQAGALINLGAMQRMNDNAAAADALTQAFALYRDLGNQLGQARALIYLGSVQTVTGDYPAATETLTQALDLFHGLSDQAGHADVLLRLAAVQFETGDYPAVTEALTQALALYRDLGNQLGQANTLDHIGSVQYETGDYPAATTTLTQALALYRELGNRLGQANAFSDLSAVQAATGDYQAATGSLTQALAASRSLGYRLGEANALNYLGALRYATGDYQAATDALNHALGLYREIGDRQGQAKALKNLGAVLCAIGDYPVANSSLTQALGLYRNIGDRPGQAEALNHLGRLFLASADKTEALGHHRRALAIARDLQSPLYEARALAGIGRCLAGGGDTGAAFDHLSQALAIYQRLNMPEAAEVTEALANIRADQLP